MSGIIINDHSVRMRPELPTRSYLALLVINESRIVSNKHPFIWKKDVYDICVWINSGSLRRQINHPETRYFVQV
jgi:hypothetical protein